MDKKMRVQQQREQEQLRSWQRPHCLKQKKDKAWYQNTALVIAEGGKDKQALLWPHGYQEYKIRLFGSLKWESAGSVASLKASLFFDIMLVLSYTSD